MTEDLWIVPLDHAWAVRSDRDGIVSEGHDCRASAQDFIDERRALEDEMRLAAEAEAEEVALLLEAAKDALISEVFSFLGAIDRGHLGDSLRFSDGTESAWLASLRNAAAPLERRST